MSGCLSDMQIALLVAGKASPALRRALSEHLLNCDECRRLVAACIKAERRDPPLEAEEAEAGPITVGNEPPWIHEIVDLMAGAERPTVISGLLRRIIPLVWLPPDPAAAAPVLAAAPEIDRVAELPTLASADRHVLVHFRRRDLGGPLVAYVIREGTAEPGSVRLVLPDRGLSFPVGADGTVELVGVGVEELAGVRVQLEMSVQRPDEEPGS
jgi:hypothetical protein